MSGFICRGCGCEMEKSQNKRKKVCGPECWVVYSKRLFKAKKKFEWLK